MVSAATQRFPLLADTWQQLGIILEHRGQRGVAIDYFRFVLQLEPERFSAIYHLAGAYRHENRTPEALDLLEKAQQRDPLSARLAGTYAENLWHLERRQEAIDAVRRAVEVDPDYQWGLDALSRWSRSVSRHDLALDLCRERAERLQHDSGAWLHVARLAHGPGHGATHLNAALRARECDPFNVDVHDTVAVAFVRQRRYTEALEACWPPEFSGRNPLNLRGREAWIFAQRGDLDKAIAAMKDLVQINPQYIWGWDMLIDWQARKKDLPAALAACERMVRLMPLVASGYLRRAEIQLQLKKETEAKRDLRRAFALAPLAAAGWRLLRLQLDGHEYPAAEETLRLMQPHIAQATMLPARMLAAAHRGQINVALDIFAEMVALPEVDANALNQAIQVIDGQKRGDLLNARLGTLMKHPQLNPFLAAVWVARRGTHFKWKLMGQYAKLTQQTRARAAFLQEWLRQTGKSRLGLETARLIRKDCAELAQQDTLVWGNLGRVLVAANQYREAMEWLAKWRERPDVEGWMVTNLVYSYHGLDRRKEADETSREILERGLRDHTTAIHLSYLAISALEAHHTDEARSLFGDIEIENQRPDQFYISRLIEAALLVQEAASPQEKTSVYLAQKPRISAKRPTKALGRTAVAQERRCLAIMASDAGNPLPATMPAPDLPPDMPPVPSPASGEEDSDEVVVRRASRPERPSGRQFIRNLRIGFFIFGVFALIVRMIAHTAMQPAPFPASTATSPPPSPTVPSSAAPASSGLAPSLPGHGNDPSGLSPRSLLQLAVDNIDQGGPVPQAFSQLDAAVRRAPNDIHILCLASEVGLRFRKFNQAVALAQRAVSQDPNDSRALGDLALPLIFTNHREESVTTADRALAIDPKNASALAAKGIAACLHRDWDHASDFISQSIDADPQKDLTWLFIDTIYRGSNHLSDGEAKVHELLQKHPDSEPGWFALGVLLNQEKMSGPAMDAFNHAKLINPNDYLLWNGIGLALGNSNDLDKAADAFKRSISLYGGYDEAWNNLGYTQLQQGNTEGAIESFKKTLAVNPRHTKALINLTHAYIKAGQNEEARKTCDLLATIDPKTADSIRTEIP